MAGVAAVIELYDRVFLGQSCLRIFSPAALGFRHRKVEFEKSEANQVGFVRPERAIAVETGRDDLTRSLRINYFPD
jgi:hypothetical protein